MENIIVKVGYGESLEKIARRFNLPVSMLAKLNGKSQVEEGDYILVPFKANAVHIVRPMQSLADISAIYGVSIEKLKQSNNIVAPLYVGQQLVIVDE